MSGNVQDWVAIGIMFAGAPALVLTRRRDAVAAGETLPRAWGPTPAPKPALAPSFLRLGRADEGMDAERRARRHEGLVRAGY